MTTAAREVATTVPSPWLMTMAEFNATRAQLFAAGEFACKDFLSDAAAAAAPAQRRKVELETGKAKRAADAVWNAPNGLGAGELVARLTAANLRLVQAKAALAETEAAYIKQWIARQEGFVAYAKDHLAAWVDAGVVTLHPSERGSPLLTISSHEDAVRAALTIGHVVPEIVLEDYPRLKAKLEAQNGMAAAVERPHGG